MTYRILWLTLGPLIRLFWRQRVRGKANVPRRGGAILAANHHASIDPIFICMSFWRPVQWLAKIELVKRRKIAWFFRSAMVVPVDREAPHEDSLEAAAQVLKRGNLLGIFPEGTRSPDGRVYRGYTGVARIAQRTGAPVIPTGVIGTRRSIAKGSVVAKPVRCQVIFGRPMIFVIEPGETERDAYHRFTDQVLDAVAVLIGEDRVPDRYSRPPKRQP